MTPKDLPTVNAVLNFVSTIFLFLGFFAIKSGKKERHIQFMSAALVSSAAFLICYLIYHYHVGSVPYPHQDWTRTLYFIILVPHIILAAVMTPAILVLVYQAIKGNFEKHKKIAKWVWPVWVYVSISGVAVYLMLYVL